MPHSSWRYVLTRWLAAVNSSLPKDCSRWVSSGSAAAAARQLGQVVVVLGEDLLHVGEAVGHGVDDRPGSRPAPSPARCPTRPVTLVNVSSSRSVRASPVPSSSSSLASAQRSSVLPPLPPPSPEPESPSLPQAARPNTMRATAAPDHRPESCASGETRRSGSELTGQLLGRVRRGLAGVVAADVGEPSRAVLPQGRVVGLAPGQDGVGQVAGVDGGHRSGRSPTTAISVTPARRMSTAASRRPKAVGAPRDDPADQLQDLLGLVPVARPRRSARRGGGGRWRPGSWPTGVALSSRSFWRTISASASSAVVNSPPFRRPRRGRAGRRPPPGPRRSSGPRRWPRPAR